MIPTNEFNEALEKAKEQSFHISLDNYIYNAEHFHKKVPFFYDNSKIWWVWDNVNCCYEIKDDIDMMIKIDKILGLDGQTVNAKIKNNYLEAFKRVGRINIPKVPSVNLIQFKDKAISIETGKIHDATSEYFFTNPIPWEIGKSEETPTLDRLFKEWVGEEYVQDLYEIIAYCCYRDYPIQVILCLYGCGRNGKSQYLKVHNKFFGISNICSTELDLLAGSNSSRFEMFKLYKKLVCMLGETNFGILTSTSVLKKLVGGDTIGFEKKGKDPFDGFNYAKILIASNSLPSTEDSSDGFMRRWHIIDFPNEFPEGKDIMSTIPEIEYNNLALKITKILPKLLDKGSFKNQGSIEHRKTKYMMASNPLPIFIKENCEIEHEAFILYNQLYTEYVKYLINNKKRKVSSKEFKSSLDNEGFYLEKTTKTIKSDSNSIETKNGTFIIGLKLNTKKDTNIEKSIFCDKSDVYDNNLYQNLHIGNEVGNPAFLSQMSQNIQKPILSYKNMIKTTLDYIDSAKMVDIEKLKTTCFKKISMSKFDLFLEQAKKSGDLYEHKPGYIGRL